MLVESLNVEEVGFFWSAGKLKDMGNRLENGACAKIRPPTLLVNIVQARRAVCLNPATTFMFVALITIFKGTAKIQQGLFSQGWTEKCWKGTEFALQCPEVNKQLSFYSRGRGELLPSWCKVQTHTAHHRKLFPSTFLLCPSLFCRVLSKLHLCCASTVTERTSA